MGTGFGVAVAGAPTVMGCCAVPEGDGLVPGEDSRAWAGPAGGTAMTENATLSIYPSAIALGFVESPILDM